MKKNVFYLGLVLVAGVCLAGCKKVNYLAKAEIACNYYCVDSISASWQYLQQANSKTSEMVGIDVAKKIVLNAEMLFEEFLEEEDLNNSAICLGIIEEVKAFYGEMMFLDTEDEILQVAGVQLALDEKRNRLADAYYKEAQSAERLWHRHGDNAEYSRMQEAMKQANKYNPIKYPL